MSTPVHYLPPGREGPRTFGSPDYKKNSESHTRSSRFWISCGRSGPRGPGTWVADLSSFPRWKSCLYVCGWRYIHLSHSPDGANPCRRARNLVVKTRSSLMLVWKGILWNPPACLFVGQLIILPMPSSTSRINTSPCPVQPAEVCITVLIGAFLAYLPAGSESEAVYMEERERDCMSRLVSLSTVSKVGTH